VARRAIEELPGIGPARAALLREMGVTRIAELRAFSPAQLRDLFGGMGLLIAERARGRETHAIAAAELPRTIRRETSFDEPEADVAKLEGMLHYLADRAAAQARRLGATPQGVRVHLRWADGGGVARAATLPGRGEVTEVLFHAGRAIFEGLLTRRQGVRNLGIEISRLRPGPGAQIALFEVAEQARAGRLDAVTDRLREQFGFRALVRGPSLELLGQLPSDAYGFVLRTPCLTR
jgi:DNA polymerase IV